MDFKVKEIKVDELYLIKTLWGKLNQLHLQDSKFFKDHYETYTFEERCEKFRKLSCKDIRIEIIESLESEIIAYCISTVSNNIGEIESLFIEQEYRQHGLV